MKNILKRMVPLLLAIAVAGCAVWYLFVYDRDFTRDLLVTQARYLDDAGHHGLAAWFYDQAYLYADNDASVAIELAQQYKDHGNYTKAEYTLTRAISKNPSAELYTALCKTFVEQDKLIDAVRLLDKISDPALKLELDTMRPTAPTVSQTPGFYKEYISVDIFCESGTLLFSTDREYPSLHQDRYTESLSLGQGETIVYALCIGENGLVSPLSVYGYTIGGVIEEVSFADAAIEAEIRKVLGIEADIPVYTDALWSITEFTVPRNAVEYKDLSLLTSLSSLTLYDAKQANLEFLHNLPQLQTLTIYGSELNSQALNAISAMSGLTRLTLAQCSLSDISFLTPLSQLSYLDLSYNFIKDLSSLSHMSALETLYLSHNALADLSYLSGLSGLKNLNISYNSISSIQSICSNRNLVSLNVSNNLLEDLDDLDLLPSLESLDASYNNLTQITVLGRCTAMKELNISNNPIEDISPLEALDGLRELNCSYNRISFLPNWTSTCGLIILDASYNHINDITALGQLQGLNRVNMDYNPELSSVAALASCPNLIEVNLFGTRVTDVSMLTDLSIIVNYNPTEVNVEVPETT